MSEHEDRSMKITKSEKQIEKRLKKGEQNLRDLWDTIKWANKCIVRVPEGERKKR